MGFTGPIIQLTSHARRHASVSEASLAPHILTHETLTKACAKATPTTAGDSNIQVLIKPVSADTLKSALVSGLEAWMKHRKDCSSDSSINPREVSADSLSTALKDIHSLHSIIRPAIETQTQIGGDKSTVDGDILVPHGRLLLRLPESNEASLRLGQPVPHGRLLLKLPESNEASLHLDQPVPNAARRPSQSGHRQQQQQQQQQQENELPATLLERRAREKWDSGLRFLLVDDSATNRKVPT